MDKFTASEIAYKNGYEQGYKDACEKVSEIVQETLLNEDKEISSANGDNNGK